MFNQIIFISIWRSTGTLPICLVTSDIVINYTVHKKNHFEVLK